MSKIRARLVRGWMGGLLALVVTGDTGAHQKTTRAIGEAGTIQATTGVIEGLVDVRRRSRSRMRPAVGALGNEPSRSAVDRNRSVVYLETAPLDAFEPTGPTRASLDQKDETFLPYVVPIRVGTVVDFPNNDDIFHNVFSLSKARRFDLGRYPEGQSKSVRFDTPGVVRVFCEIHSHMNAYIIVFSHPFFAATDARGRYRLDGVPPGRYKLIVWSDGEAREESWVRVEAARTTKRDFVVE